MVIRDITSENNQVVREIHHMNNKRGRRKNALFFVEGYKFIMEGITAGWDIVRLVVSQSFRESDEFHLITGVYKTGEPIYSVSDKLFCKMSDTETPQGILAVFKQREYKSNDLLAGNRLIVLLDNIRDPGNLGTIIRTADAAAFSGVVCIKGCVDVYGPKVIRSTAGSIFHIPVLRREGAQEIIGVLQGAGIRVFSTGREYSLNHYDADLKRNAAIIIGNESTGVDKQTSRFADTGISLPVPGKAESLNASVAAGIIIYESVRQRKG